MAQSHLSKLAAIHLRKGRRRNLTLNVNTFTYFVGLDPVVQSCCLLLQGNFVTDFNRNRSGPLGYKPLSQNREG